MIAQTPTVIRYSEKTKTVTSKSEYLFHLTSHPPSAEDICYFEGYYKDAGLKAGLHIHKTITEIFTVLEGEFTFHLQQGSAVLGPGDTIIASPFQPHGFSSNLPHSRMQLLSIGFKNREKFFIELEKIVNDGSHLNPDEWESFFNRYDQYYLQ
jgi:mannose-6-phosphate isomerase-like protein (cupin superfamily)